CGKGAHLDPDLERSSRPRLPGWRPSLGQTGAASGHLSNQGVGPGDLFLFYGWFRPTAMLSTGLRFIPKCDGFHAIFGYLQVSEVIRTARGDAVPAWLAGHPHSSGRRVKNNTNSIYLSAPHLSWDAGVPGAGVFRFCQQLLLSKPGMPRSCWALDRMVFGGVVISYHSPAAWRDDYFKSYPRAQEYVIAPDERVIHWAHEVVAAGTLSAQGK